LEAFQTGYLTDTTQFELDTEKIYTAIADETRTQTVYGTTGEFFDVGRIAIDHPEVWLKRKRTPAKPAVNLLVQIGYTGDIRQNQIYNRGVCIATLVKLLENAQYPLNLQLLINFHRNRTGMYTAYIDFPTNPLDIDLLNYTLTSRMFYRRLGFSFNNWLRDTTCEIDYGQVRLYQIPESTVYFPCIEGTYDFRTLEDAKARILETLNNSFINHQNN
jgi:hypothetical protein